MIENRPGLRWRPGRNPFALDVARMLGEDARENLNVPQWKLETLRVGTREQADANAGIPAGGVWYQYVSNPAVGAEMLWLNTYADVVLQPFYVKFRIATSAAVGNRIPVLVVRDSAGSVVWAYGNVSLGGTSGAGTTKLHQYFTNCEQNTQGVGWGVAPIYASDHWLANLLILPGWSIGTGFSVTLDVGDQIYDIAIGLRVVA